VWFEAAVKAIPRTLYLAAFIGLAMVAVLSFNTIVHPSMAGILTRAVFIAAACAVPGLIYRKLWPLALVLLPVGCYVFVRTLMPVPALVEGVSAQYHYYLEQLNQGLIDYKSSTFPLLVWESSELQLAVAFVVYWLMAAAAFSAVALRRPLPAVALVLVLLGFTMTVDTSARALWPAFLFLVLAACLFVLSRSLDRSAWRLRDAVTGALVGAAGGGLALLLLAAAPSTASAAWYDWHTWDLQGGSVYTFNWLQNYPSLLDPGNNTPVMKVSSPSPSYWRANALDNFTGSAWVTSQAFSRRLIAERDGNRYVYSVPASDPTPPGKTVTESFSLDKSISTNYLFIGGDPKSIATDDEVAPRLNGMRSVRVSTPLASSVNYSATAVIPELRPADLVGRGRVYPSELSAYLTLPFSRIADVEGADKQAAWRAGLSENTPGAQDWLELYSLNERIIREATDPYQIALRIEQYLRRFYSYSLTPPASEYSSPYAAFLFDTRSGYCQHFAGAMALLLRYNSIPSRVAVGFAPGVETSDGIYQVTTNNAHAWVEAYFPTIGWVAFDPTPGRNVPTTGASSTSPGFVNPFTDPLPSGSTTPATQPPRIPSENPQSGNETPQGQGKTWLSRAAWLPWVAGIVVLMAGWPVTRSLWRRRHLHRGSYEKRLQASLGLLRSDLRDYGAPVSAAQTLDQVLDGVRRHVGLQADPSLVDRTDAILFGGRRARHQDLEQAESFRRSVKLRLRKRHGWLRTTFAWYGVPRSNS
jgi:transglutaminase-like putative cysteine protease